MAATATADEEYRIVSTAFDQAFYRTVHAELDGPGFDPIRHYVGRGWREGRDPAPWFSSQRYLERHADVAALGVEPLAHYLRQGAHEGREIFPSEHAGSFIGAGGGFDWSFEPPTIAPGPRIRSVAAPAPVPESPPAAVSTRGDRRTVAAEFDRGFYLASNPDIAEAGVEPLEHFLAHGWREGRDPAPWFSVREYLQDNPDIVSAGVNPFAHYVAAGRAEGRAPRSRLGFRYRIIAGLQPLEERLAVAAQRTQRVEPAPSAALAKAAAESRTALRDLHITFSHDDFTANLGGVQLCLQYEAAQVAELGRDHLHICPAAPWPMLRRGETALLSVVLNGRSLGAFPAADICASLAAAPRGGRRSFAIHNLLGHSVDEVVAILEAAGLSAGFFWLHDFTSLCAGVHLMRNDVQDCGAPAPDSPACGICVYGAARGVQIDEHQRLFHKLRLTIVSPSATTLAFWRSRSALPSADEVVLPHLRLRRGARAAVSSAGPLRIAFLGFPAAHKGWPVFAELAEAHADDPRYRFLHLGGVRDPRSTVEFHSVSVSRDEPLAMSRAVDRLKVDVAVIWSLVRETFCFAAHEAVAGGAAVITGPDSGNVAAFAQETGHGLVFADEAALARALAQGELLSLARRVRQPSLYDLEFSGMTADLLETGVAA